MQTNTPRFQLAHLGSSRFKVTSARPEVTQQVEVETEKDSHDSGKKGKSKIWPEVNRDGSIRLLRLQSAHVLLQSNFKRLLIVC